MHIFRPSVGGVPYTRYLYYLRGTEGRMEGWNAKYYVPLLFFKKAGDKKTIGESSGQFMGYLVLQISGHNSHWSSHINPFKPNGISLRYQLKQSISVLRVVWLYFSFLSKF